MLTSKILWHTLKFEALFDELKVAKQGLSSDKAKEHLARFGPNVLPEDKPLSKFAIFWRQMRSPLVYVLFIAALITAVLREFIDMGVILAAVVVNATIGFWQEMKADEAFAVLKAMVKHTARVRRDGHEIMVDASLIVPGDVLVLHAGDKISADARLLTVFDFEVNEAALTGESLPVHKHIKPLSAATMLAERANMVFQGTTVARGKAEAIVVSTGKNTAFGEIALLVHKIEDQHTPLQAQLHKLAQFLGVITVLIAVAIFIIGALQGRSLTEMFLTAVAVAVAAIPEGLLVSLTVILAIGMRGLARRNAIVKRLLAAETLGSVSVICADKTGTLTSGEMTVTEIIVYDKKGPAKYETLSQGYGDDAVRKNGKRRELMMPQNIKRALEIAVVGNEAIIENPEAPQEEWKISGDPTSRALLVAGIVAGLNSTKLNRAFAKVDEIPFDTAHKWAATLHRHVGADLASARGGAQGHTLHVRGAPEKILQASSAILVDGQVIKINPNHKRSLLRVLESMASRGERVVATAYRQIPNAEKSLRQLRRNSDPPSDLIFVGFLGMKDPLRANTQETVKIAKKAGIRTVMITGDHAKTALAIGKEVGLSGEVLSGDEIDKLSDDVLREHIDKVSIFARVLPKHKVRIVEMFHARGQAVAMTGDGVNDAPALKAADIGVAVGSGTDVAQEAADVILLDNNLKTIVGAVEGGRNIYENVKKVVAFLLSTSWKELIIVAGSLVFGLPIPVIAAQILWINLIEDSFPSMALAFDPPEPGLMTENPRKKDAPLLDPQLNILIFGVGITASLLLFGFYYYLFTEGYELAYVRTMIFVGLGVNTLFSIYSIRSLHRFLWRVNPLTNKFLFISIIASVGMLLGAVYFPWFQQILRTVPLKWTDWLPLVGLGVINVVLIELVKGIFIIRKRKQVVSV